MEKLRSWVRAGTSGREEKIAVVVRRHGLRRRDICEGALWYSRRPRGIMRPRYGDMVGEVWGMLESSEEKCDESLVLAGTDSE